MGGIAWTPEEDQLLRVCIERHGEGKWHRIPLLAGLNRCRKSCRLRWLNYLHPNIKRGNFTNEEVERIIELHKLYGNKWSLIARKLPGRTSNDVKNYWNCHLSKRLDSHHIVESKSTTNQKITSEKSENNNIVPFEPHGWQECKTTQNTMEVTKPWPRNNAAVNSMQLQDDHGARASILPQDEPHYDIYHDNKYSRVEDHNVLEELLSKDIDHLEDIQIRGGGDDEQTNVCKWDFDDLTLDVELWTDSL